MNLRNYFAVATLLAITISIIAVPSLSKFSSAQQGGGEDEHPNIKVIMGDKYSSKLYTDIMINYINKFKDSGNSFFGYHLFEVAPTPFQASQELKHDVVYDTGWDNIREQRFENQKELGISPANSTHLPPPQPTNLTHLPPSQPTWSGSTEDEGKNLANNQSNESSKELMNKSKE